MLSVVWRECFIASDIVEFVALRLVRRETQIFVPVLVPTHVCIWKDHKTQESLTTAHRLEWYRGHT